MASIWDFIDSLPKRSDVTPEELARRRQGYADLYQGGLLARNRDQMPLSVQGAQATQDFLPVIGDALALGEAGEALSRGELAAAGLLGAGAAIGLVPGVGDALAKPVMAAGRKLADAIPSDALYAGRSIAEGDMRGVLDAFAPSRPAQGLGADAVKPALRVFHGTDAKINTLDPDFSRTARDLYTTPVRDDAAMYGKNVLEFDVSGSVGDFRADTRGSAANKIMKNVYSEHGLGDYFDSFDDFVDAFDSGDMYQRFGNSRAQDDVVAGLLDAGGFDAIRIPDAGFGGRMSESVVARDPSVFKSPPPATPAQEVAGLLSSGRADEVTDEMLAKFTPKDEMELFDLYQRGATGMDLPMDEVSRMARAQGMGFDTGVPLYHGTDKDFSAFDPRRFGEKDPGWYGRGVTSDTDPEVAAGYADYNEPEMGQQIIPNFAKGRYIEWPEGQLPFGNPRDSIAGTKDMQSLGYAGSRMTNDRDLYGDLPDIQSEYVTFDPANIRSRFARFDPRLAHLRNLSAGVGGLGLLSSMMPPEEQY